MSWVWYTMLLRAFIHFVHVSTFKKRSWRRKWDPGLLPSTQVLSLLGYGLILLVFIFLSIDILIIYINVKTLMGYVENVRLIHHKDYNVLNPGWGFCFVLALFVCLFDFFSWEWGIHMSSYRCLHTSSQCFNYHIKGAFPPPAVPREQE